MSNPTEPPSIQPLSLSVDPLSSALPGTAAPPATENAGVTSNAEQNIDPWNVQGAVVDGKIQAIDYDKLIQQFGTRKISPELLAKFERVTGHKPHRFLRRGYFFSHRDLESILDRYEQGKPFFLYTGRGPSSDIIMLTDDEKFLFKQELKIPDVKKYTKQNAKDIIAVGFDPKKTFIFSDFDFMGGAFYENVMAVAKCITTNQSKSVFGFDDSQRKINKYAFSGGQTTTEEQRKYGGNPDVDVSYQYLSFLLDDDEELEKIRQSYRKGELLTGELKKICIETLQNFVKEFQDRRKAVGDEELNEFMRVRPLVWGIEQQEERARIAKEKKDAEKAAAAAAKEKEAA
ncbi:hypothetical protein AA313_de0205306 [Arthrobotrys entomopaga]|nr:hypothetical protein AA313_de0205306 [Arthrobotrys entomopaga]